MEMSWLNFTTIMFILCRGNVLNWNSELEDFENNSLEVFFFYVIVQARHSILFYYYLCKNCYVVLVKKAHIHKFWWYNLTTWDKLILNCLLSSIG